MGRIKKVIRPKISPEQVQLSVLEVAGKLKSRLQKKGDGSYAGKHEVLGIIAEEYDELKDAIRDDEGGIEPVAQELMDIAVGCIFGLACIRAGVIK